MIDSINPSLFSLVHSFSTALDLVSPVLVNHHLRVAYIASELSRQLNLPSNQEEQIIMASALHDIGAFSFKERRQFIEFEAEFELSGVHQHAEVGYFLLKQFKPFTQLAKFIRFHHVFWNEGEGQEFKGKSVPPASHLIHLSDRLAVLISDKKPIWEQVENIAQKIQGQNGRMFSPALVEALLNIAPREYFWMDLISPDLGSILSKRVNQQKIRLKTDQLLTLAQTFAHVVDFRSPFTASHSSQVAKTAEILGKSLGFSQTESELLKVAGYLHDLGKLAISEEILEKPGPLNASELKQIKSHPYYTYRILERIDHFEVINRWASLHHERLDGQGYPFHLAADKIPLGAKIMAVADVATALIENRPYQKGMDPQKTIGILKTMVKNQALDEKVVKIFEKKLPQIIPVQEKIQQTEINNYHKTIQKSS